MSVRPFVRVEQLGSYRTDFNEIWYLSIFRKTVEKIQVSLKSGANNGYFTRIPIDIFNHISLSSQNEQDRQGTCNVTLRRVHATIVAVLDVPPAFTLF